MSKNTNGSRVHFWEIVSVLVIAFSPLYYLSIGGLGIYQIFGLLQVMALVLSFLSIRKISIPNYSVWYFVFMMFVVISTTIQGRNAFQAVKIYGMTFLTMLCFKPYKKVQGIYMYITIVNMIVGIYMLINNELTYQGRLSITIGSIQQDPNWCALFFVIPFNYALYNIKNGGNSRTMLLAACLLLCVYITVLTGSRGALLGLLISMLVWVLGRRKSRLKNLVLMILAALIGAVVLADFIPSNMLERILSAKDGDSRLIIWANLIREYGAGNVFQILFGRGDNACLSVLGIGAHNDILETLFEFGIVGLVARIVFWTELIVATRKARNDIGVSVLIALLTESMFSPIQSIIYFALPIAAVSYENMRLCPQAIKVTNLKIGG